MKARIQSGEKIPLEDLRAFILSAERDLSANRVQVNKAEKTKATDVDFF